MGIRATINRIASIIEGLTPVFEPNVPYSRVEADTKGRVNDIKANPSTAVTRQFVVRTKDVLAKDDGEAGTPSGRLTQVIYVEVVYKTTRGPAWLQPQMNEDNHQIQRAMQSPLDWLASTTGIVSIAPALQPTNTELDAGEETVARLLTIPFPVTYREVSP